MATAIVFHEVEDGKYGANAWKKKREANTKCLPSVPAWTFREPENPSSTGLILVVPVK